MDLINQIDETLSFNNENIRVVGTYDEPWFVAKDVCNILGISNVSMALTKLPEKWKGVKVIDTLGGDQNLRIINESGVYKIIMRSNKPIAEKFQEVVCEEILPSIRKTGEFKLQKMLEKQNDLLKIKEEDNKKLEQEKNKISVILNEQKKELKSLHSLVKRKKKK